MIVTTWMEGVSLAAVIREGSQEDRDRASALLAQFLFSGPVLAGMLHADPHPGNFRLLPDGRLGVIDFGAVNRLPDGAPEPIGRLARLALEGRAEEVLGLAARRGLRQARASRSTPSGSSTTSGRCWRRSRRTSFQFSREWLRHEAIRVADPRSPANQLGRQLNLPPHYLLIHRVTTGTIGVLCQLSGVAPFRALMETWQPGFAPPGTVDAPHAASSPPGLVELALDRPHVVAGAAARTSTATPRSLTCIDQVTGFSSTVVPHTPQVLVTTAAVSPHDGDSAVPSWHRAQEGQPTRTTWSCCRARSCRRRTCRRGCPGRRSRGSACSPRS